MGPKVLIINSLMHVKRSDSEVRMVVDACRPHDIREKTHPEYFYRYIPLSRINGDVHCSFPSLSAYEDIKEGGSTTLIQCNLGSVEAAAKVCTLEVTGSSADEVKNFEFNCLGEVRILSILKHPCIVKFLGHQMFTKWLPSRDEIPEHRVLQSAIFMENVKGGSLKGYVKKLGRSGEKHVPVNLALQIVRDVAWALSEVHSKDIIHRDLKSENILIDLYEESDGSTAVVKLCDFDRAVPLRSWLHTCCIGHMGIPPPVPRNAIGNIIWNAVAKCDANERLTLDTMVGCVKDGIGKVDTRFVEKFKCENGSDNVIDEIQKLGSQMSSYDADYYSSSSMCNSGIYDADFGWGRPVWCCLGYLNNDVPLYANVILLMDTRNGDVVEAWVTLSQEEMEIVERDPELLLYASVEPSPLQG